MIGACEDGQNPTTAPAPPPTTPPSPPAPPPPPEPPATPTGLRVSATTENSIIWTWNAVEGATAYAVQISMDEMFGDDDAVALALAPTHTVSDLAPSTSIYLRVQAVAGTSLEDALRSEWSPHVTGMTAMPPPPPPEPPATPTGLRVSATTENSVTWTWNAVEGATAYAVQISMDEMFGDDDAVALALAPTHTVSDLAPSTSIYLRVQAVAGTSLEDALRSEWSPHVTGMTAMPPPPLPEPPAVPSGLQVSASGVDFVEWSWNAVEGADGYEVQFSTNEMFDNAETIGRTADETSYRRQPLPAGTTAFVRVRSYSGAGEDRLESAWSTHLTGMTTMPPPPPVKVSFVEESERVTEGETIEIKVAVSGEAGEPLRILVAAEQDTVVDADYELLTSVLEIPPSGVSDATATITLRALEDDYFAEGDETLWLRLGTPQESDVEFGPRLALTIDDAGVSPCDGIRVRVDPPTEFPGGGGVVQTRLTLVSDIGAQTVAADWVGPYDDYREQVSRGVSQNQFNLVVEDWSFRTEGVTSHQQITFKWNPEEEFGLRFRSRDGACAGGPVLACTGAGCEMRD